MTCNICTTIPIGATFNMTSSDRGATCVHCHQLMLGFFPQLAEYEGFTPNGQHQFRLLSPPICPHCGKVARTAWAECDDNGGYYMLQETNLEKAQNQQSQATLQQLSLLSL